MEQEITRFKALRYVLCLLGAGLFFTALTFIGQVPESIAQTREENVRSIRERSVFGQVALVEQTRSRVGKVLKGGRWSSQVAAWGHLCKVFTYGSKGEARAAYVEWYSASLISAIGPEEPTIVLALLEFFLEAGVLWLAFILVGRRLGVRRVGRLLGLVWLLIAGSVVLTSALLNVPFAPDLGEEFKTFLSGAFLVLCIGSLVIVVRALLDILESDWYRFGAVIALYIVIATGLGYLLERLASAL